jgi:signal peptidase II
VSIYIKMKLWFLAPVFIIIDQLTKFLARTLLSEKVVSIFSDVRLQLAFNKGFAFSLPAPQLILILFAIGVSGFLIFWSIKKERTMYEKWTAVFLVSGAIGNVIDRIIFHEVTDFLAFWSFPIFNVADVLVTVGVVVLLSQEIKTMNELK